MLLLEQEVEVPAVRGNDSLLAYLSGAVSGQLTGDMVPIRFAVTESDERTYQCELGVFAGAAAAGRLDIAPSELKVLMLMQMALAVLAAGIVPLLALLGRSGPMATRLGATVVIPLLNLCVGVLVGVLAGTGVSVGGGGGGWSGSTTRLATSIKTWSCP